MTKWPTNQNRHYQQHLPTAPQKDDHAFVAGDTALPHGVDQTVQRYRLIPPTHRHSQDGSLLEHRIDTVKNMAVEVAAE